MYVCVCARVCVCVRSGHPHFSCCDEAEALLPPLWCGLCGWLWMWCVVFKWWCFTWICCSCPHIDGSDKKVKLCLNNSLFLPTSVRRYGMAGTSDFLVGVLEAAGQCHGPTRSRPLTTGLFQWRCWTRVSFVERKFEIYVTCASNKTSVAAVTVEVPERKYRLDVCRPADSCYRVWVSVDEHPAAVCLVMKVAACWNRAMTCDQVHMDQEGWRNEWAEWFAQRQYIAWLKSVVQWPAVPTCYTEI
jgi:hypothetical protein